MNSNKVIVRDGDIDKAIKRFKVVVAKSGVPSEIKKRKHYEKPGVKKREEKKKNIRNSRKHHNN